jgi:hypothetical protein
MKVEIWIVLQNVEEFFEISKFFKSWDKKKVLKPTQISQLPLIFLQNSNGFEFRAQKSMKNGI